MTQTDTLIARLSADPVPRLHRPCPGSRMALSILVPVVLFLLTFGTRSDLGQAWSNPVVPFKTLLPLATCILSLRLVLRLMRPEARLGAGAWCHAVPLGLGLSLWAAAFVAPPPRAGFGDIGAEAVAECLGSILCLAILPAALLLRLARRGASPMPRLSAGLAGLTAASGVTAGYSLFCIRDDPLFFVTWYGVAILTVSLVSAVAGRRMLLW